jgi:hypothetical protein
VRWPSGAIEYIDELLLAEQSAGQPPRNALVQFDWAQLAIWRWYPRLRVHYDGRHRTVYTLEIEHEHFAFLGLDAPGEWSAAIRERPTDLVLVEAGSSEDQRMRNESGWGLAYVDGIAALFLRDWTDPTVMGPATPAPTAFETRIGR